MSKIITKLAFAGMFLSTSAVGAISADYFNRIASFPVIQNLPQGKDASSLSSSEIIAASEDGMTLVYSDSPLGAIGFVDIKEPSAPKALGAVLVEGEPTSVAVAGSNVFAAINTSKSYSEPSGKLVTLSLSDRNELASCELGGQPDSIAVSPDKSLLAIAIENERDEDLNDGALPQLPAGYLVSLALNDGLVDCSSLKKIELTGLADIGADDPEPEFVSINEKNEIAVTLQENNHIVIVDGKSAQVLSHFSAGAVDLAQIDVKSNGAIAFDGEQLSRKREPDAIKWLDDNRLVVANEGDYEGGSRGFTIFDRSGKVLYEAGASFEHAVAQLGHYPETRSKAKGIEPEGLEVAKFGDDTLIFVLAERASVVGVYKDTGAEPELLQILPSGISPEGAVAIPSRGLLATANEADLIEDGGARSHVMLYQYGAELASYPQIRSNLKDGLPIAFGALSGLVADENEAGKLYAVSDSIYANSPRIFQVDVTQVPAVITDAITVTRDGQVAQKMDMEGIALDGNGGFWLANEGNRDKAYPHALINVNAKGEIKAEIPLPVEIQEGETRFGLEGVTRIGTGDDATLWMAMQREWGTDEKGFVKLLSYHIKSKEWGAVRYPLDKADKGWVGLSEITAHGDHVYMVERDNQIGDAAKIKKLYRVALADLKPGKIGETLPLVTKEEAFDFLPALKAQTNGYVVDKVEGFAIDSAGQAFVVTDNDGVDNSSGETLFFTVDLNATN
jgi:hypothetical protein